MKPRIPKRVWLAYSLDNGGWWEMFTTRALAEYWSDDSEAKGPFLLVPMAPKKPRRKGRK